MKKIILLSLGISSLVTAAPKKPANVKAVAPVEAAPVAAPVPAPAPAAPGLDMNRSRSFVYAAGILKPSSVTYQLMTTGITPQSADFNRKVIDGGVALGYLGTWNISGNVFFGFDIAGEYYAILSNKTTAKIGGTEVDSSNFTQNTSSLSLHPLFGYRFSEHIAVAAGFGASMNVQLGAKRDGKDLNPALSAVSYGGYGTAALYITWSRLLISPQFRYDFHFGSAYTDISGLSTRNGASKSIVPDYIFEARLAIGYNYN
ncbi:MAG: hypothetical protein J0L53_09160 [Spirochaetes bacterium]|nr:hypothetical protein [Spirochaetota bacterium]